MYVKKNLMLWVAVLALALPLLLVGTAGAKYMSDGAVQDGVTGGWKTPNDMVCIVGVHADGTLDIADGVTNSRDCIYLNKGTMNGGTPFDLTGMTTSAACTTAGGAGNDGAKHSWATSFCMAPDGSGLSLKDLDRTSQMCTAKGGTWVTTGKCVAYGRDFKGQDADGTPLAFGTEGTAAGVAGFCYAYMDTGLGAAACPSTVGSGSGTQAASSTAAFGYVIHSTLCDYQFGITGNVDQNLSRGTWSSYKNVSGVTVAPGTFVDLSTITTQGDCIAAGYNWTNWIPKATTAAIGSITTAATFDLTRQAVDADEGCLHCHSSVTQYNGPAERWKDSYLKTGHKNMLRKVTAGKKWAGPDGVTYDLTGAATGALNFGTLGNNDATAAIGGIDKPLLYIFGDWMAAAPAGLDVIVNMSGSAKYNGTSDYSCAACHTAGWSNTDPAKGLCTLSSKTTQAACTTAGGVWTPLSGVQAIGTPGYAAKQPGDSFPGIAFGAAGQWDNDGIMCSRCHNATVPSVTAAQIAASSFPTTTPHSGGMGNLGPAGPSGEWATKLCYSCHQSIAKTINGTGADADLANPTAIPVKNTASAPAYVPGLSGHVLGGSFLNSPHARFTGTIAPNSLGKYDIASGTYSSDFKGYTCWQSSTSNSPAKTKADGHEITTKAECETLYGAGAWRADTRGNCTTCHDVHQSLFVAGQEGLRKECESCHENLVYKTDVPSATQVESALINHPTGTGTPFDTSRFINSCEVCHMPKPTSADFPMHVWRINTDVAYSTFPTASEFGIGATPTKKNANTAPDGTYANAVWVDVDLACGQCHGGSSSTTYNGAPYKTKLQLAAQAAGMHIKALGANAKPVAAHGAVTVNAYTVSFADASTDEDALPAGAISVNWGDGTVETGNKNQTFTHTYASRSRTYTIVHTVTDLGGMSAGERFTVSVPTKYTVSGAISTGAGTRLYLKKNGHTVKAITAAGGTYTFTNVVPGTYTITAYKRGSSFSKPAVTSFSVTNANVTGKDISAL